MNMVSNEATTPRDVCVLLRADRERAATNLVSSGMLKEQASAVIPSGHN
jgi:hypothetical protein